MQDEQQQQPAAPATQAEPAGEWQYTDDGSASPAPVSTGQHEAVSWTASEFIAHDKTTGWYLVLIAVALGVSAITYFFMGKGIFAPIGVLIVAALFGVVAARKPRELPYSIDSKGIHIGNKKHSFAEFKSFSVVQEEGVEAIWLLPLQRFAPGLSIYFSPEDKDRILAILDDFLPVEQRELDFVDQLMHKIRF